jgi:hypothetical protein
MTGCALFLLLSTGVAQDKNTATIKGKVGVEKGSPAGVAVTILQGEREVAQTLSDKGGNFQIKRLPPGIYSVKFRKAGFAVGTIDNVTLKAKDSRTFKDIILSVDEGSIVFIRGSVFNEASRSVPGVRVDIVKVVSENSVVKLDSRITGETGEFVFRLPPDPAKYRLIIRADDAEPSSKDVDVESAAVYRVALIYKKKQS